MPNTKTGLAILAALLITGAGYMAFAQSSAPGVSNTTLQSTTTNSQAKLDINAVCEGALANMTFPDSASANAFVQECKDGKYPEVIEKYKADHGFGDGAAI